LTGRLIWIIIDIKIIVLAISQLGRRLLALLLFETKCHSNSASITVISYVLRNMDHNIALFLDA